MRYVFLVVVLGATFFAGIRYHEINAALKNAASNFSVSYKGEPVSFP